jgi:hypothetical protein
MPDQSVNQLRARVDDIVDGITHGISGHNTLFRELFMLASMPMGFSIVDRALTDIIAAERERAILPDQRITAAFQSAVLGRAELLTKFARAPAVCLEDTIGQLVECGLKDCEGEPEGNSKALAEASLKTLERHHPRMQNEISAALQALKDR